MGSIMAEKKLPGADYAKKQRERAKKSMKSNVGRMPPGDDMTPKPRPRPKSARPKSRPKKMKEGGAVPDLADFLRMTPPGSVALGAKDLYDYLMGSKDKKKSGSKSSGSNYMKYQTPYPEPRPKDLIPTPRSRPKGMKSGGSAKMPMKTDPKTGEKKPTFAMDGKGKMMSGGKVSKPKGSKMQARGGGAAVKGKGYSRSG